MLLSRAYLYHPADYAFQKTRFVSGPSHREAKDSFQISGLRFGLQWSSKRGEWIADRKETVIRARLSGEPEWHENIHGKTSLAKGKVTELYSLIPKDALPQNAQIFGLTIRFTDKDSHFLKADNYIHPGNRIKFLNPADSSDDEFRSYSVVDVDRQRDHVDVSLIVRQMKHQDETSGKTVYGVVSQYLATRKLGDAVNVGLRLSNEFLLPPRKDPIIFVSTGIASMGPGFDMMHARLFLQQGKLGKTFFYAGHPTNEQERLLGGEMYRKWANGIEENFLYRPAISQEGKKQRVNVPIKEDIRDLLLVLLDPHGVVYVCGIEDVKKTVMEAFEEAALTLRKADLRSAVLKLTLAGKLPIFQAAKYCWRKPQFILKDALEKMCDEERFRSEGVRESQRHIPKSLATGK